MNNFLFIAPIVAGVYLIGIEMRLTAHTLFGTLVYKLLPFLAGLASIIAGLKLGGLI